LAQVSPLTSPPQSLTAAMQAGPAETGVRQKRSVAVALLGFLGAAAFVGVYMGQGGSHAPSTGSIAALPVFPLLEEAAALQVPVSMDRRSVLRGAAAGAAALPLAAMADGANSKATAERARQMYGSRVFRLQSASPETILEEKNAFTLFTTGTYRTQGPLDKAAKKTLNELSKKALAAAGKGDQAGAQAAVKEFVKFAEIRELDTVAGGNFNPLQRRNPGAPPTSEIEAQMGTQAFSLYEPLKTGAGYKLKN